MFKKIYRKFLFALMDSKLYKWFMNHVVWRLRLTTQHTRCDGYKYHRGYDKLESGMFGISIDEKKASTFLIPGFATHAWYCTSKGGRYYETIEMTHKGLTRSFFYDICREADRVLILDCVLWDKEYKQDMISRAVNLGPNIPYDIKFNLGIESLYCSELIYQLDYNRRLNADLSDLVGLGRPYISPDGLLFAENTRCVWDSDGLFTGMSGPDIEAYFWNKKLGAK